MKYVKTFESFNYHSLNEGVKEILGSDKFARGLEIVKNYMEKNKTIENLPEDAKKKIQSFVQEKTGKMDDQSIVSKATQEVSATTSDAKKEPEIEQVNQEVESEIKERYSFEGQEMINEELFKWLGQKWDKFVTRVGAIFGLSTFLGGGFMMLASGIGWASNVFTGAHVALYGLFGIYTPLIGLVLVVLGIILLFRKYMVFSTKNPDTGERCKSWTEASEVWVKHPFAN